MDRAAGLGRGLKHGIVKADGEPREKMVGAYRAGFEALLSEIEEAARAPAVRRAK